MKHNEFILKVLNGLSIGIVVALIPGALLGELMKALQDVFPFSTEIINITAFATRMLPLIIGFCIALQFELSPIECSSISIAAAVGSGVAKATEKGAFIFSGTGDVINTALTATIAVCIVFLLRNKTKAYTILLIPMVVIVGAGYLGLFFLPYIMMITSFLGNIINSFTSLQPMLMTILIAVSFAYIIVSPVSSVGIALAIQLSGIGSGAANLGITAAAIGLGIAGYSVNGLGTTIAHFLGSPKIQVSNFIKKPRILYPIACNAAVLGVLAQVFDIKGTPLSAGFGISGLIGPINALNLLGRTPTSLDFVIIFSVFVIIPTILAFLFNYIFMNNLKILSPQDYKIDFQ